MKKFFNRICSKVKSVVTNAVAAVHRTCFAVQAKLICARAQLADCTGDLATNTIGAIIVAVVIVGLLVAAVDAFFPGFFTEMFNSMKTKLNANW